MTIKEIQEHSLKILKEILIIAKKHNFKIYPAWGTLLGIVRHKGKFIPWDDDIDVAIMRKDIKPFFKLLDKELPKDIKTRGAWKEGARSTSSIVFKEVKGETLAVDFFEIINIKDEIKNTKKLGMAIAKWYVRASIGGGLQKFARTLLSIRSKEHYKRRRDLLINQTASDKVTKRAMHVVDDDFDDFDFEKFIDVKKTTFEGLEWVVPKDPNNYLTTFYGNWKKTPSEKQKKKYQHYDFEEE